MKIGCVVLRGEWTVWIIDGIGFAVGSAFAENDTALMRKKRHDQPHLDIESNFTASAGLRDIE
jgi:hypothetical protein